MIPSTDCTQDFAGMQGPADCSCNLHKFIQDSGWIALAVSPEWIAIAASMNECPKLKFARLTTFKILKYVPTVKGSAESKQAFLEVKRSEMLGSRADQH